MAESGEELKSLLMRVKQESEKPSLKLSIVKTKIMGFPGCSDDKESACKAPGLDPWVGEIPWRRECQPTPIFLPGEFHGQRNLVGYIPWGCKESDATDD